MTSNLPDELPEPAVGHDSRDPETGSHPREGGRTTCPNRQGIAAGHRSRPCRTRRAIGDAAWYGASPHTMETPSNQTEGPRGRRRQGLLAAALNELPQGQGIPLGPWDRVRIDQRPGRRRDGGASQARRPLGPCRRARRPVRLRTGHQGRRRLPRPAGRHRTGALARGARGEARSDPRDRDPAHPPDARRAPRGPAAEPPPLLARADAPRLPDPGRVPGTWRSTAAP